mmetsp:Transcript_25504/g.72037  ORF Transcript_25504/g.72037 Transcript_25504/m.72037 type:complete len:535 (-) Transcript_25504:213-1817(-)
MLEISFYFHFDGGVDKHVDARILGAHGGDLSWTDYIPELAWLFFIGSLLWQELVQVCTMCYRRRLKEYAMDIMNLLDWFSIFFGLAIVGYWYLIVQMTTALSDDVAALPRAPPGQGLDLPGYHARWAGVLDDVSDIYVWKQYHQLCLFWYTLVISCRFLKGFLGQATLAMVQMSVASAFWDAAHFLIVFLVVLANFVLGGRILFGAMLWDWSTFSRASNASIQLLLGSFDFDPMYDIAPVSATIWFWLFLCTMVFVLSNIFLVMIIDRFVTFKNMIGPTLPMLADIQTAFKEFLWRCEWRIENVKDSEYAAAVSNPYADLVEGLIDIAQVPETMEAASRVSCLGLKLCRKQQEDSSVEELGQELDQGNQVTTSLELREMGCDAMTAEHILEECEVFAEREAGFTHQTQTQQVRRFVQLLRDHHKKISEHCAMVESGLVEDHEALAGSLERLEESVLDSLEGFADLRSTGVDSLAPPLPGQRNAKSITFVSTQSQLNTSVPNTPGDLRRAGRSARSGHDRHTHRDAGRAPPALHG